MNPEGKAPLVRVDILPAGDRHFLIRHASGAAGDSLVVARDFVRTAATRPCGLTGTR
jgi:hypothetical protein